MVALFSDAQGTSLILNLRSSDGQEGHANKSIASPIRPSSQHMRLWPNEGSAPEMACSDGDRLHTKRHATYAAAVRLAARRAGHAHAQSAQRWLNLKSRMTLCLDSATEVAHGRPEATLRIIGSS